jgi:hypothetical protein
MKGAKLNFKAISIFPCLLAFGNDLEGYIILIQAKIFIVLAFFINLLREVKLEVLFHISKSK